MPVWFRGNDGRVQLVNTHYVRAVNAENAEQVIAPEILVLSTYGDASLAKVDDEGKVTDPPYPTRIGAGRYGSKLHFWDSCPWSCPSSATSCSRR